MTQNTEYIYIIPTKYIFKITKIMLLQLFTLFTLMTVCWNQYTPSYSLTLYMNQNCRYCKFANSQLSYLIYEDMQWSQKIQYIAIDCNLEEHRNKCRDTNNQPLLVLSGYSAHGNLQKIAQLGGVQGYYYFKDWIEEKVELKHNISSQVIINGYYVKQMLNQEDIVKDYEIELRRKEKIKSKKFNIIQSVLNQDKEIQASENQSPSQTDFSIKQNVEEQNAQPSVEPENKPQVQPETKTTSKPQHEAAIFQGFSTLGYLAMGISLTALIIVKSRGRNNQNQYQGVHQTNRVSTNMLIRDTDDEDFD